MMGQIILSKSIPVELSLLEVYGVMDGMKLIGYCSWRSFILVDSMMMEMVSEVKLIGLAVGMLFLVLGIMPVRNEK